MKLGHLAITVKDMEKALDFYCRVLGLKKAFEFANPKDGSPWIVYLYLGEGEYIELFYDGTVDNAWRPELRGFNHIAILVDDCVKKCEEIKAAGYPIDREPNKSDVDKNWQAWLTDPDGIRVELMQLDPECPQMQFAKSQGK
jgi:lactoylglutathione lyase